MSFWEFFSVRGKNEKHQKYFMNKDIHTYVEPMDEKTANVYFMASFKKQMDGTYAISYSGNDICQILKLNKDEKCVIHRIDEMQKHTNLPTNCTVTIDLKFVSNEDPVSVTSEIGPCEKKFKTFNTLYKSPLDSRMTAKLIGRERFLDFLPVDTNPNVEVNLSDIHKSTTYYPTEYAVHVSSFWPTIVNRSLNYLKDKYNSPLCTDKFEEFDFNIYDVKDNRSLCSMSSRIYPILKEEIKTNYFDKMRYLQSDSKNSKLNKFRTTIKNVEKLTEKTYYCSMVIRIIYITFDESKIDFDRHRFKKISGSQYLFK